LADLQAKYGDVVGYQMGGTRFIVLYDPALIERVFMDTTGAFERDEMMRQLSRVTGHGLLSIDGEAWRRHRRLMSPAMRRSQVQVHAGTALALTRKHLSTWGTESTRDVYQDMMRLSMDVSARTLLNLSIPDEVAHLVEGVDAAMDYLMKELMGLWRLVPGFVTAAHRRRFFRARGNAVASVERCIERRRGDPTPGHDLLYLLLSTRDPGDAALTPEELRDEILSMLLAGYETTALALTYALYAVARFPSVQQRVREEATRVLGSAAPDSERCKQLEYTRAVLDESLRMYPPTWVVARQAAAPVEVAGHLVQAGTQILMPSSIVHRDARWFDASQEFRPERWLVPASWPRFSYFPFGGGARTCIGNHAALMSGTLALATIVQHVELSPTSAEELRFIPSVTLRPDGDIRLRMRAVVHDSRDVAVRESA
jgi:cytochrome P450